MVRSAIVLAVFLVIGAASLAAEIPSTCPAGDLDPIAALEIQALRRRIVALEERAEIMEHELLSDRPASLQPQEDRP